ncbi:Putative uncharacterized protein [Leuconostoc citreum LBAE C11]|nr:Putative uncharacterized protein [Leuconostoc citreum LBAE C11]
MIKINLFLISYIPLYILVYLQLIANKYFEYKNTFHSKNVLKNIFRIVHQNSVFEYWILAVIVVPSLIFSIYVFYRLSKDKGSNQIIGNIKRFDDNIISYLMTYVIPFLTAGININSQMVTNVVLFVIIMIIYVRMDLVYLNPTLILIGYNIYTDNSDGIKYLTKNSPQQITTAQQNKEKLKATRITDSFYYISKRISKR